MKIFGMRITSYNWLPTALFCLLVMNYSVHTQTIVQVNRAIAPENYRIGVGDVLKVLVSKQALLSLDGVRVNNDGKIRLPMLEFDITASCLTEAELAAAITTSYKKYLVAPQVYVAVQEFNSNPVAFIGAVNNPGRFDVRRPTRLLELLTFVNGPAKTAGDSVQIIRRSDMGSCAVDRTEVDDQIENQEVISVSLKQIQKGDERANPFVQAGDIITIAEADAPHEAYIIGNVKGPRAIVLIEPITLSKAIAMAGGVSAGAKINRIEITRQDGKTQATTKTIVNLEEINKGKRDDIVLLANDIVDVPGPKPSLLKDIFRNLIPFARLPIPIL
jgi:polysaccharide biosynthesis/export protein